MDFPGWDHRSEKLNKVFTRYQNVVQYPYPTTMDFSTHNICRDLNQTKEWKMWQLRYCPVNTTMFVDNAIDTVALCSHGSDRKYAERPFASYQCRQWIACSNSVKRNINEEAPAEIGDSKKSKQWIGFVSGLLAGMIGTLTGHPFDTLKTRMQVYGNMNYGGVSDGKRNQGRGGRGNSQSLPYDVFVKIRRLYAGLLPPLVTTGLIQTINFGVYDNTLKYLKQKERERRQESTNQFSETNITSSSSSSYSCFNHFLAGAVGGTSITLITCPSSLIKIQLQLSKDKGYGIRDIFQRALYLTIPNRSIKIGGAGSSGQTFTLSLFSQGPHTVLYRALLPDFIAQSMGRGVYMYTYEYSKRLLLHYSPSQFHQSKSDLSMYQRIVAGGLAGVTGWLSVYPIDVLKSRLQADALSREHKRQYKGLVDCFLKSYRAGGLRGLYSGLSYTLLRAVPVASVILPSYDFVYHMLEEKYT